MQRVTNAGVDVMKESLHTARENVNCNLTVDNRRNAAYNFIIVSSAYTPCLFGKSSYDYDLPKKADCKPNQ